MNANPAGTTYDGQLAARAAELRRNWTARTAVLEQSRNTADRRCDSNAAPVLTHALSRKDKDLMDTVIAVLAIAAALAVTVALAAASALASMLADAVTANISTRRLREGLATLVKIGDQR